MSFLQVLGVREGAVGQAERLGPYRRRKALVRDQSVEVESPLRFLKHILVLNGTIWKQIRNLCLIKYNLIKYATR